MQQGKPCPGIKTAAAQIEEELFVDQYHGKFNEWFDRKCLIINGLILNTSDYVKRSEEKLFAPA